MKVQALFPQSQTIVEPKEWQALEP